jgi:hypothetical protein
MKLPERIAIFLGVLKARQGKARQGKQGKARQGKARQGKARQGKGSRWDNVRPAAPSLLACRKIRADA